MTKKAFKTTKELQADVANAVIAQMQTHGTDWLKSWQGVAGMNPLSMSTGKNYQGINWVILNMSRTVRGYSSHQWATFKQWKTRGASVRKGEKGVGVVFYKSITIEDKETGEEKSIPMLKFYTVFNSEQVDGYTDETPAFVPRDDVSVADEFTAQCGAKVQNVDLASAHYAPGPDHINMPYLQQFDTPEDYQATLLHELTHWTGHKSRLDRLYKNEDRTKDYAMEELVAELGSAMLCGSLEISSTPRVDHAKYLNNWMRALKNDPGVIFKAAAAAAKATDYLVALANETKADTAKVQQIA